ncbi:MAG: hypothetical protein ACFFEY_01650 [Candidatus Thorarchaeota archaeon]
MHNKKIPVIIGAAQTTQKKDTNIPLDPLKLISEASQKALAMSGVPNLRAYIDTIYMSTISSWLYEDAANKLSKLLGIKLGEEYTAPISGNTPQLLVNKAAKAIFNEKSKAILIAGGEASYSRYRAKKGQITLNWPKPPLKAIDKANKAIIFYLSQFENQYKLNNPPYVYALIETAVRAASGRSMELYLNYIGQIYERFSKIASNNLYAWDQNQYSAEEIITPSNENRKVCHPYTKHLIANLYVDQAASIVMTSEEMAEKLDIDDRFWVYPMGGVDLNNIFYLPQRPNFYDSPAIREGSRLVLDQAGLKLEDIDAFDLYSCFPCMVEISRREIGIPEDDPRDLTITGGLSFFGGPFSSYSMHSIVTAFNLILKNPSLKIMVLANGGYNTVQSFGIYGKQPPAKLWDEFHYEEIQKIINTKSLPKPVEKASGNLKVEAYTIIFDRNGLPEYAVVIGKLNNHQRAFAFIMTDSETFSRLEKQELVGKTFLVKYDSELKCNKIVI